MDNMDFIGFTYNGLHSYENLGIYRTSDGSRYTENLTATMTDKVVDVPGGDGQYYFGTTFKNRTFNINYAFEGLTDAKLALLKETFKGDGIHDLIFDERPNEVWSAKVTGTATIKYICFDDDKKGRLYNGEGSITFTCYNPFARNITQTIIENENIATHIVGGNKPTPFSLIINFTNVENNPEITSITTQSNIITFNQPIVPIDGVDYIWDSKTGLFKQNNLIYGYSGNGIQYLIPDAPTGLTITGNNLEYINNSIKRKKYNVTLKYYELY